MAIAQPERGEQMLEAVRETDGEFMALSEDEILAAFIFWIIFIISIVVSFIFTG